MNRTLFVVLIIVVILTLGHVIVTWMTPSMFTGAAVGGSSRRLAPAEQDHQRHHEGEHTVDDASSLTHAPNHEPAAVAAATASSSSCRKLRLHKNASLVNVKSVLLCQPHHPSCRSASVVVELAASECANLNSFAITGNQRLKKQFRENGPHLFRLRFDGPAVVVVPQAPLASSSSATGRCAYTFQLSDSAFVVSGKFRIGLEMLYRKFQHVDETRDLWPEVLKQPLLAEQLGFTTKYHLQQCTLPSSQFLTCSAAASSSLSPLEYCNGRELDTSGVWRRDQEEDRMVYTRVRVRKIRKEPILFEWASQPERAARWIPRACRILDVAREELFRKFGGKRIVISGDSQLRALYYAVVNTLYGNGDRCVRNMTTVLSEPPGCIANVKGSQRKSIPPPSSIIKGLASPMQVDYIDDLFLNRVKHKLRGYDVVIAGFGQHPASREHWRYDKYFSAVNQRMGELKKLLVQSGAAAAAAATTIVWYAAPHYPHTRNGYPVVVRDWRTDARLAVFNNYSFTAARSAGFATLDSFSVSDAFMHTSPDQAHFSNFVASEFVRMLFSVLMSP